MIVSKGAALCKLLKTTNAITNVRNMSGHHFVYRAAAPPHSKKTLIISQIAGGTMWWWILWHLWHDYEHITGEFPYPDPSKWTNSELGVPDN